METTARGPLGRHAKPASELLHFVRRLRPTGGFGTGLAGHALALTPSADMTTPGTLPSGGVIRRHHRQYYGPLGLPLHSTRFHLRLIRATLPRPRPRRRVSPLPPRSLLACCSPYPGGTRRAFFSGPLRSGRGLRGDMSRSAPPWWI